MVGCFLTESLWSLPFPCRLLYIPRITRHKRETRSRTQEGNGTGTRRVGLSGVQSLVCTKSSELTQFGGQAKVNNLDLCPGGVDADNVLRLEVQVDDVLLVHVLHALQDLLHVAGARGLRVLKVVVDQAFEELAACNTGTQTRLCSVLKRYTMMLFLSPPHTHTHPDQKNYSSNIIVRILKGGEETPATRTAPSDGLLFTLRLGRLPSTLLSELSCLLPCFATHKHRNRKCQQHRKDVLTLTSEALPQAKHVPTRRCWAGSQSHTVP